MNTNSKRSVKASGLTRRVFMARSAGFVGAAALGAFGSRRADAKFLPSKDAVVETTHGKIRGGVADDVFIFRGVPYGADTSGENRFMPPKPPKKWAGVRDTVEYGHACPQEGYDLTRPSGISWFTPFFPQEYSEDCLRLNVWTPAINSGGKRPVMVWLHGGGFANGSGASSAYEGTRVVKRGDVVVVTVNHRLNAFGYTDFSQVLGEDYGSSGNAGMLDIIQALEWVRDNIEQFGGDPNTVMIYGESGGGAKVSTLMGMPAAKGLFHRAVIQSGAATRVGTRETGKRSAEALLKELGIKPNAIKKLRAVPAEQLKEAMIASDGSFRPVLGADIPAHPFDPEGSPLSAHVPLMVGSNHDEITLFQTTDMKMYNLDEEGLLEYTKRLVNENAEMLIAAYRKTMPADATPSDVYIHLASDMRFRLSSITLSERKHAQGEAPVYMYRFDWRAPAWEGRFRAAHAFEIPFVFDNAQMSDDITGGGPDAVALAAKMSDAWISFARNGDPNHEDLPEWRAFDPQSRATMLFNDVSKCVNDPDKEARLAWMKIRGG